MGYDKHKVIEVATSQIGYHEKASGSNLDSDTGNSGSANWTKYARDLDALSGFYNGRKNGFAWCDVFVDWCFVKAYGRAGAQYLLCQPDNSAGAGCSFSAQYFNAKGQFHKGDPQPGDQIFFGSGWNNVWHTGLVISVGNNHVYTVEGNTTDSVGRRSYALNDSSIWGYGRPDYAAAASAINAHEDPEDEPVMVVPDVSTVDTSESVQLPALPDGWCWVALPVLQIGDESEAVRAAQYLLQGRGFPVGWMGTDGDFGRKTESAVGRYQADRQLERDGIIGPETWRKLICE